MSRAPAPVRYGEVAAAVEARSAREAAPMRVPTWLVPMLVQVCSMLIGGTWIVAEMHATGRGFDARLTRIENKLDRSAQ